MTEMGVCQVAGSTLEGPGFSLKREKYAEGVYVQARTRCWRG